MPIVRIPGVKIYHVDARLAYFETQNNKAIFKHYCDEVSDAGKPNIAPDKVKKNINVAHNNSTNTENTEEKELNLKNYLYELELNHVGSSVSGCADNLNLFRSGDVYKDINKNWHKLNTTDYNITIVGNTFRDATIKFEKVVKA